MFSATRNESEVQTDGRYILRSKNFEVLKCEESLDLEKEEDVLNDIRLEWVDRPEHVSLDNHRFLSRCACQLAMITAVLSDYSRSYSRIEGSVLDATLEYGLKAHNVYSHALRRWLETNPKSSAQAKVQNLVTNYPKREKESLQRYCKRAYRELEDRLLGSSSRLSRSGSPAQSRVSVLSSRTLEERQHMARLKQQVNVDKKNVAECSNPFTGGPAFTRSRKRNEQVPETSRGAFVYSRQTTAPSNSQHQVPEVEARYDRDYIPLSLERELMKESSKGFPFSGSNISEYPAYFLFILSLYLSS